MRESKPSADAIKASDGRLRKLLFVVTSRANHGFAPLKENIQAHFAYLSQLELTGKLFMAGPLFDEQPNSWSGDGLLIYNSVSLEEATEIAVNDPLHLSGARSFYIRPWLWNDGCLNLTIRFSDQVTQIA